MPCRTLVKFADDMALVARLQDENCLAEYFFQLHVLNSWLKESFLDLNILKTKELVFDSRKEKAGTISSSNNRPTVRGSSV